jgi:hypothetical protein
LQGKKSPNRRFSEVLCAKRNKLLASLPRRDRRRRTVIPNLKIIAAKFRKVLEKQTVQSEKTMKQVPVLSLYRLIRILQHGQSGCFIVFYLKKPS